MRYGELLRVSQPVLPTACAHAQAAPPSAVAELPLGLLSAHVKNDRQKLLKLGFQPAGHWELTTGIPHCILHRYADTRGVLYAFMCGERVMYIGKTRLSLRQRMNGYQRPGTSQRTNVRNNSYIHEQLEGKQEVEILAFPPVKQQIYKGFCINLAAGLEDSVIEHFSPKWNISGKMQEA
jgi:hypothetical protein